MASARQGADDERLAILSVAASSWRRGEFLLAHRAATLNRGLRMINALIIMSIAFFLFMWWKISRTKEVTTGIALLGALIATVAAPFLFIVAAVVVTLKFFELMWHEITT